MGVIRKVAAGTAGGVAGTLAMDLVWYARYRRGRQGEQGFLAWETASGTTGYEQASAPGKVGRTLIRALTGSEPPASSARLVTNAVHWATGVQWAVAYAALAPAWLRSRPLVGGIALATGAFAASYTVLPLLGVYQPIYRYDARTLAQDYTAHLTYGQAAARLTGALLP